MGRGVTKTAITWFKSSIVKPLTSLYSKSIVVFEILPLVYTRHRYHHINRYFNVVLCWKISISYTLMRTVAPTSRSMYSIEHGALFDVCSSSPIYYIHNHQH